VLKQSNRRAMKISQTDRVKPCPAAFTLIEVAVAVAVMGLVMAGMFEGYILASRRAQYASYSLAASAQAMLRMERIVGSSWTVSGTPCTNLFNPSLTNTTTVALCMPSNGTNLAYATNIVTVQQLSTNPPYVWVQVSCVWGFMGLGTFTNTVGLLKAPST
jgi:prepilin-type N-terminal cleavage/methylation domain-containing protein